MIVPQAEPRKYPMASYEKFSRFYDVVMGDRTKTAAYIRRLITHYKPEAKTLLELACGTGAILQPLSEAYDVTGLDLSAQMLAVARQKLPHVRFYQADMVTFNLGKKFDVIICVFDSLNHVLQSADWQRLFRRVAWHLAAEGLFLFDINPVEKLRRLIQAPPWVKEFNGNVLVMDVMDGGGEITTWNIKVFVRQAKDQYRLFAENIQEISFPVKQITGALREHFTKVKVTDPTGRKPSDKSDRLYFVCSR
jgi:SAM-dependent methyltransferase